MIPSTIVPLAPTPRDVVRREGRSRLLRFRPAPGPDARAESGPPLLLIPSMINRWYVLDLRSGASMVEALVAAGHTVYCLDWGVPQDEDRHFDWDRAVARVRRAVRWTLRDSGAKELGLLGYCMGATLSAIHVALHPEGIGAFVDLAGPIDFSHAGFLGTMTDPRWFDPDAIADAGNMSAQQMQSGFVALRPTAQLAKVWGFLDRVVLDPKAREAGSGNPLRSPSAEAFFALETWANDNVPFPAAAYRRYIGDLYQRNELVKGEHRVAGQRVDLANIRCPIMVVTASRDTICPPEAALALGERSGSEDVESVQIPGGHVGAVVGRRASSTLYPTLDRWFRSKLWN